MAEEFQKGIAGILEKLSKMKEPEENKTIENQTQLSFLLNQTFLIFLRI